MLFSEEDAPLLKKWIVKRLENTSDADADVLADYVLALLRHDGDVETVRQLCEAEIPDFLKEDSTIFVQDVFDAIHYKTYIPGRQLPPRRPSIPLAPPSGPSAQSYGSLGGVPGASGTPLGPQNGTRKRSYNDRGDGDAQDRGYPGGDQNSRVFKQPRRGGPMGGRGGRENFPLSGGGYNAGRPAPLNFQNPQQGFPGMAGMPSPPPGMPPFDPNNPMAALLAMQALGFPVPGLAGQSPSSPIAASPIPSRKQRCRDYDIKGFCARGNTCPYEHGEHSIWVPPAHKQDEYDPTNSTLMTGVETSGPPSFNNFRGGERGRGRGTFRGGNNPQASGRRGGRSEYSSNQPNYDKNNTSIVVENIPEEKFSEDEVRGFFGQFGSITEVSMRPYKRLAIVKYEDWNSAKSAYSSPKVIFDNRFVKVYWFVDQESLPQPPSVSTANGGLKKSSSPANSSTAPKQEPELDLEEFARKQEEAQKAHEEKTRKKQEMEAARKELEKRQEELLKSQAEEKRKLMEKIAAKSAKSGPNGSHNGTQAPTDAKPSATDALKAQLAALEAEAQSLGIDTSLSDESSWPPTRGRGRGRGGYRGRGAPYVPRGSRGGYRGRGSAPFPPGGRSFSIDNRTKKVGLTGVDFSDAEKDESLRQYLLGIGEYTDIEVTPARTAITFKDRFTAEKFMYSTPNGEIPSAGKVDMAWIQIPLPPVNTLNKSSSLPAAKNGNEDDTSMAEGDAMAESSPAHAMGGQEQEENLDYDVADDNDWDIQ